MMLSLRAELRNHPHGVRRKACGKVCSQMRGKAALKGAAADLDDAVHSRLRRESQRRIGTFALFEPFSLWTT
jgi:hypothetical protein